MLYRATGNNCEKIIIRRYIYKSESFAPYNIRGSVCCLTYGSASAPIKCRCYREVSGCTCRSSKIKTSLKHMLRHLLHPGKNDAWKGIKQRIRIYTVSVCACRILITAPFSFIFPRLYALLRVRHKSYISQLRAHHQGRRDVPLAQVLGPN